MTASDAKKIPLPDVLRALGHQPSNARKGGGDLWYLSPFRKELEPSFHVNVAQNVWFDFGLGQGGDVAAFAMQYFGCRLPDALRQLEALFPDKPAALPRPETLPEALAAPPDAAAFKLLRTEPLTHPALVKYLTAERFIRLQTARRFLREIYFEHTGTGKQYFAAGLPNLAGGWEIRNPYFKSCIGDKAMSHLPGQSPSLSVFEGMLDFLSAFDYYGAALTDGHVLVLHSVAFAERAIEFAQAGRFSRIYTYFDNDRAGEEVNELFTAQFKSILEPSHGLYFPCKDFNEWAVRRGQR